MCSHLLFTEDVTLGSHLKSLRLRTCPTACILDHGTETGKVFASGPCGAAGIAGARVSVQTCLQVSCPVAGRAGLFCTVAASVHVPPAERVCGSNSPTQSPALPFPFSQVEVPGGYGRPSHRGFSRYRHHDSRAVRVTTCTCSSEELPFPVLGPFFNGVFDFSSFSCESSLMCGS